MLLHIDEAILCRVRFDAHSGVPDGCKQLAVARVPYFDKSRLTALNGSIFDL